MESKKGLSAEVIIIAIVVVVAIVAIIYFSLSNKKEEFVYGVAEASSESQNTLIEDYKSYKRLISKAGVDDEITIDYKKSSMKERYTEEFFNTKKLAVIVVSEDTSKDYFYKVTDVKYNEDRTQATITYVYKAEGYTGTLSRSWFDYMFVELDGTVTTVNFAVDNSEGENK